MNQVDSDTQIGETIMPYDSVEDVIDCDVGDLVDELIFDEIDLEFGND